MRTNSMRRPLTLGEETVQVESAPPLAWESLVTDGHVRAARLRWLQPWLYGLGLLALLAGMWMFGQIKPHAAVNNRDDRLYAQVAAAQRKALIAFNGLAQPTIREEDLPKVLTGERIKAGIEAIRVELNRSDALPGKDQLPIQLESPSEFWRKPWPIDRFVATGKGDVKIVGVIGRSDDSAERGRWMGVYRKRGGTWSLVSVVGEGFENFSDYPAVSITDIPITLKPLLKTRAGGLGNK